MPYAQNNSFTKKDVVTTETGHPWLLDTLRLPYVLRSAFAVIGIAGAVAGAVAAAPAAHPSGHPVAAGACVQWNRAHECILYHA